MSKFIEVKDLTKTFKIYDHQSGLIGSFANLFSRSHRTVTAVDRVSFSIDQGEIIGYLGPNGAGKSTTIKMLTGILVPTSGEVIVNGFVPHRQRKENAKQIGVVFGQRTHLWFDLPVKESFELLRHIYKIPIDRYNNNIKLFNEILEIDRFFNTPVRQLSLGQRMRSDIAAALLHDPKVIFLDEPTIGLDVVAKQRIREFIKKINVERNVTIILTTHDLDDVEKLCERVILIDHAKVIYDGSLSNIRRLLSNERLLIIDYTDQLSEVKIPDARIVHHENQRISYRYSVDQISTTQMIGKILAAFDVADLSIQEPEVEEVVRLIYEQKLTPPLEFTNE